MLFIILEHYSSAWEVFPKNIISLKVMKYLADNLKYLLFCHIICSFSRINFSQIKKIFFLLFKEKIKIIRRILIMLIISQQLLFDLFRTQLQTDSAEHVSMLLQSFCTNF